MLEGTHKTGGAATTEAPGREAPGARVTRLSCVMSLMLPAIIGDVELARHGGKIYPIGPYCQTFPGGGSIKPYADHAQRVEGGQAAGVVPENGEEIRAGVVVATLHPRTAFLDHIGENNLPAGIVADIRNWKSRSGVVKIPWPALDGRPDTLVAQFLAAPFPPGQEQSAP